MKTALLSVSTQDGINIGDYIQALASAQFVGKNSLFIERERLDKYDGDDVIMIMNGWYMHNPEHWPPSSKIHPLFVAFHLNDLVDKVLLGEESVNYFKKHEPIGCRDKKTADKLIQHGVKAYFSGCMTLTLGYKYNTNENTGKVFFTDPPIVFSHKVDRIIYTLLLLVKFKSKYRIYKKWHGKDKFSWKYLSEVSRFYHVYGRLFSKEMLLKAEYIQQQAAFYHKFKTPGKMMAEAERLVEEYAKAACVVTSRIHCALPCLGLGTPVIFVYNDKQDKISSCRLDGLKQLFNIVHDTGNKLIPDFDINGENRIITEHNFPKNNDNWKVYADMLIKKCEEFVKPIQNEGSKNC